MEEGRSRIGAGARPRFKRSRVNQPVPGAQQPINEGQPEQNQRPEFGDLSFILLDWRLFQGIIGKVLSQKAAICWAIVLARLLEAAYNLSMGDNKDLFIETSYKHLVKKLKSNTDKEMEIYSLNKSFKFLREKGIAKLSPTSAQNDELAQKIIWNFEAKNDADRDFIETKVNASPVGLIIEIDDEFRALREAIYNVRRVQPGRNGNVTKHAIMIVAIGRDPNGQHFFICQNSWNQTWGVNGYGRISIGDDMRCLVFYPIVG